MLDGHTRKATVEDIKPGVILRHVQSDGTSPPFSDMVVTDAWTDKHGLVANIVRPFSSAKSPTREEVFELYEERVNLFHVVLNSKGEPYMMNY